MKKLPCRSSIELKKKETKEKSGGVDLSVSDAGIIFNKRMNEVEGCDEQRKFGRGSGAVY